MTGLWRTLFAVILLAVVGGASAEGVTLPAVERIELDNGAVLLLVERHDVPLIGIEAVVRGCAGRLFPSDCRILRR